MVEPYAPALWAATNTFSLVPQFKTECVYMLTMCSGFRDQSSVLLSINTVWFSLYNPLWLQYRHVARVRSYHP